MGNPVEARIITFDRNIALLIAPSKKYGIVGIPICGERSLLQQPGAVPTSG
jgi:hypothetical protein